MIITAFVTNSSVPLTSPGDLPEIQIVRVDTGAIVQAFTAMTELANLSGVYFFDFTSVDGLDYAFLIDADPNTTGQVTAGERYQAGSFSGTVEARIETDIPDILGDTVDIQSRLPAALVGGRMDSDVGNMQAGVVDAAAIATDAIDADAIAANAIGASEIANDAITAAKIATDAIDADALATDAVNEIRDSILADSTPFNGADIAAILADTAVIGTPAGASIAADIAALLAELRRLIVAVETTASAGATPTTIPTGLTEADDFYNNMQAVFINAAGVVARNIDDYANTGGTLTVTALPFTPAATDPVIILARTGSVPVDVSAIADGVWNEDIVADHGGPSSAGLLLRVLGALISTRANNATLNALLGVPDSPGEDVPSEVDTVLTAAHGAGSWTTAPASIITPKQSYAYDAANDILKGNIWIESANAIGPITAIVATLYDRTGASVFTFTTVAGPDAQGVWRVEQSAPGLVRGESYYVIASLTVTGIGAVVTGKGTFTVGG